MLDEMTPAQFAERYAYEQIRGDEWDQTALLASLIHNAAVLLSAVFLGQAPQESSFLSPDKFKPTQSRSPAKRRVMTGAQMEAWAKARYG